MSSATRGKCASLGREVVAARCDVKEDFGLSLGIFWLCGALLLVCFGYVVHYSFLVKE
jgi:hypothetical protein